MINVWRVGSHWGEEGGSIPDIFKRYGIAFAGDDAQDQMGQVKVDDIVAITHGQPIIGVGRVSRVGRLSEFGLENFEYFGDITALVLSPLFWKDEEDQWLDYGGQGKQFHQAHGHYEEEIIKIYDKLNRQNQKDKMKDEIEALLKANKQIVLTGAPGTGKTFLAKEVAAHLLACQNVEELNQDKCKERYGFVQFHPAYDYTDFVEGLKPVPGEKDQIVFELRPGIFMDFCEAARKRKEQACVFVIDEINRADLSRVFGELFFALEPNYRGEKGKVLMQYASLRKAKHLDPLFYVPENVFIIGTMNDIDRSVMSMDFALRRRFVWYEIEANVPRFNAVMNGVLSDKPELLAEAKERYEKLNDAIGDKKGPGEGLGPAYKIGPAYFLNYFRNSEKWNTDDQKDIWDNLWRRHLEPLIREYVRGMPDEEARLEKFKNAYMKQPTTTQS